MALFIVAGKGGGQIALQNFADAAVQGVSGTLALVLAMAFVARKGHGILVMLLVGYLAWFTTVFVLDFFRKDSKVLAAD